MNIVLYHLLIFTTFNLTIDKIHGAKILGVFFMPCYSHQQVYQELYKELSLRGHEVTAITTRPLNDSSLKNLTEINVSYLEKFIPKDLEKLMIEVPSIKFHRLASHTRGLLAEQLFIDENVRKLYENPNQHFDMVIVEALSPLLYAFAGRFKAKLVLISSTTGLLSDHRVIGNPNHPALYGDMMLTFHTQLTIWQKMYYTLYMIHDIYFYDYELHFQQETTIKKYFSKWINSSFTELKKNVSLLLLNENSVLFPVRPLVPTTVLMGFMHIKPIKKLPRDLQEILDKSTQGVIYFSLGTSVLSSHLNNELKEVIIQTFSELPYIVLCKLQKFDNLKIPDNVVARKWFPQQDVLAHPNVKAFVTQGGIQSLEEAITQAVPVVGMPFLYDQYTNVKKAASIGIGIEVDRKTLTKTILKTAIVQVVENERYKDKIIQIRRIAFDQPMTGLEKAVWWCEYVLRHNGTAHLRSASADISMYEYLLLDVIFVFLLLLLGFLITIRFVYRDVMTKQKKYKIQ